MKKFLAYLLVIVITVSLGFAVFYLVRDNEKISLTTTTLYKDKGSTFELALDMSKNNSYTKITVSSSNENVVSITDKTIDVKKGVAKATLLANEGGLVRVNFQTNNSKFRNLYCDITVGDGTAENPYHIDSATQLALIGNDPTGKYTLDSCYEIVSNIDLSIAGDTWKPIGSEANKFVGQINGNGHTIYNLNIENSSSQNIGLFAYVGKGAKIENFVLSNSTITTTTSTLSVGAVAGVNQGTISRVEVSNATISNNNDTTYVGGIAGKNLSDFPISATIIRCSADVNFDGGEGANGNTLPISGNIGGITALNKGGTIAYAYTKSANQIVLSDKVAVYGGIVGQNEFQSKGSASTYSNDLTGFVRDCYTILSVDTSATSTSASIGAIAGENEDRTDIDEIVGCYYLENSISTTGIGGVADNSDNIVTKSMSATMMKTLSNYESHIEKIPYIDDQSGSVATKDGETIMWNSEIWYTESGTNDGYPILEMSAMEINPTIIGTDFEVVDSLSELHSRIGAKLDGSYYVSDITDNQTYSWTPIGTETNPFTGTICAENGVIDGLKIRTSNDYAGFIGYNSGLIKGLTLKNVIVEGSNIVCAGAICAYNNGSVVDCSVIDADISATTFVGGIAGQNNGTITGCKVYGDAGTTIKSIGTDRAYVGGIAGANNATISSSKTTTNGVTVTTYSEVGGKTILSSQNDINGDLYIGGIAGKNDGAIKQAVAKLNNTDAGIQSTSKGYFGGIAGYNNGSIEIVRAETKISADKNKETYVGGIAGAFVAKTFSDKITFANVTNSDIEGKYVGGIVSTLDTTYDQKYDIDSNILMAIYSEQHQISNKAYKNLEYTVYASAVQDGVVLKGQYTGGIAYDINKGFVLDTYSQASLSGKYNAGLVYNIHFNGKAKTGGIMTRVYAVVRFANGGTNYEVSASNIHSDGMSLKNRTAGFIDEYYYTVAEGSGKAPVYSGGVIIDIGNWFTSDKNRITKRDRNQSTMKGDSLWKSYLEENPVNGDLTVWNVSGSGYPTISGLI